MLTECKLSKDEVRTLLAQVLDLKPRTCKIVLLDLLHGFSLEEAIQHSVRLQTISDQED